MIRTLMLLIADGTTVVNSATSQLRSILTSLFDLIGVVLSIICAIGLTVTIGKWILTEHESKEALLKWGSGFILGIVLLGIVKLTA